MQIAIIQKVQKFVVLNNTYSQSLKDVQSFICALLEKTIVAQGRHQGDDSITALCCACSHGEQSLCTLADYAFVNIQNGDLLIQNRANFERKPCNNFELKQDESIAF